MRKVCMTCLAEWEIEPYWFVGVTHGFCGKAHALIWREWAKLPKEGRPSLPDYFQARYGAKEVRE